jgi:hypothetical protein
MKHNRNNSDNGNHNNNQGYFPVQQRIQGQGQLTEFKEKNKRGADLRRNNIASKEKARYVEGIVQNFQISPSVDTPAERWIKSFFIGVPYTTEPTRISFNVLDRGGLQNMKLGGVNSVNVQIYGSVSSGDISNGQEVEVWGKMNSNQVLHANRIRNKRNGVETTISRAVPASIIRLLTCGTLVTVLLVLFVLIRGVQGIHGLDLQTVSSGIRGWMKLAAIIVIFLIGSRICRSFRIPMKVWLIACAIITCIFVPQVAAILIVLAVIVYLLKIMI